MTTTLSATAQNGQRCINERHRFRIGVDATAATEFEADQCGFHDAILDALIDHVASGRPGKPAIGLFIQVLCGGAGWRNLQAAGSGNVIAITPAIAGERESAERLFELACASVQMARDIDAIAGGLAGEVD